MESGRIWSDIQKDKNIASAIRILNQIRDLSRISIKKIKKETRPKNEKISSALLSKT